MPLSRRHESHPYPKGRQETSSRKSDLPRKTCLPLSTALFTEEGSEHVSGKISEMVPVSDALPGLLSGACSSPGTTHSSGYLMGCIRDEGTCRSDQRHQAGPPATASWHASSWDHPVVPHRGRCGDPSRSTVCSPVPAPAPSQALSREGTAGTGKRGCSPGRHAAPCPRRQQRQSASRGFGGRKREGGASLKKKSSTPQTRHSWVIKTKRQ